MKKFVWITFFSTLILIIFVKAGFCQSISIDRKRTSKSDTARIYKDLKFITKEGINRNYKNLDTLNKVAKYIKTRFLEISDLVEEQKFIVKGFEYKNIICSLGPKDAKRIVIGAHYDVCKDQEGADDNASGVAGLIELGRMLKDTPLNYRIDFVAYTLEEPPYFRTENMGSFIHAKSLFNNGVDIYGMISLEMIGYFSDEKDSQDFPLSIMELFYGDVGNFITIVQKYGSGKFGRKFNKFMKQEQILPTKTFKGPEWLEGVNYSDHRNYWKFGYDAVMVTNTAFFRDKCYHKQCDVLERLDIKRLALVVDEVYKTIIKMNTALR
jgi:hypothetical protein